ncbi:MAG: ubiquitin-like domain-containing protein, partial [Bacilli bacterium]
MVHLPTYAGQLQKHKRTLLSIGGVLLAGTALSTASVAQSKVDTFTMAGETPKFFANQAKTVQDLLNNNQIQPANNMVVLPDDKQDQAPLFRLAIVEDVELSVDGKVVTIPTRSVTVGEFLREQGIELHPFDRVEPALDAPITFQIKVKITRAFPVTLQVGSQTGEFLTTKNTVGEFLAERGYALDVDDRVSPSMDAPLTQGAVVEYTKVEEFELNQTEAIAYKTIVKKDDKLAYGERKVVTKGKNGVANNKYVVRKENDKLVKKELIESVVSQNPINEVVVQGTKQAEDKPASGDSLEGRILYVESTA